MNYTNESFILTNGNDNFSNDIEYIEFDLKKSYENNNKALKITFSNDIKYNCLIIKKLQTFEDENIIFCTNYNGKNIKYIISNYTDEILIALNAIMIKDIKAKFEYLYDSIFELLDIKWNSANPCNFCNNICISTRNKKSKKRRTRQNGCCYSFVYSKSPFKSIENLQLCSYLGSDKKCKTKNISCKLFVCSYLKKNNIFNIDIDNILLIQSFFDQKQQLILKYNYFRSKDEILDKLLEKNTMPYYFYELFSKYRI